MEDVPETRLVAKARGRVRPLDIMAFHSLAAPSACGALAEAQFHLIAALESGDRPAIWQHTAALCRGIVEMERDLVPRPQIVSALEPARRVHGESPFVHRLQAWPRGYPGDFETIEYLVGGTNLAPRGTRAWWAEQVALSSPIAVQHRCKVGRRPRRFVAPASPGRRPGCSCWRAAAAATCRR